jgi:alginate O-acetyltransferase complex protein AlgI
MLQGLFTAPAADGVHVMYWNAGLQPGVGALWCGVLAVAAGLAPNSNRIGERLHERVRATPFARGLIGGFAVSAVLALVLLNTARDSVSAFIYFNF